MDKPKTKAEARERGLKFYNTGKPCRNGHFSDRYRSGFCVECRKEKNKRVWKTKRTREPGVHPADGIIPGARVYINGKLVEDKK